jgi:hypothetical protein
VAVGFDDAIEKLEDGLALGFRKPLDSVKTPKDSAVSWTGSV